MGAGDMILVSLREIGDEKGDVIHKYYPEEAQELQELGEIPDNITISFANDAGSDEDGGDDNENQGSAKPRYINVGVFLN